MRPKSQDFNLLKALGYSARYIASRGYSHLIEPLAFAPTAAIEFYLANEGRENNILYSCYDANDALRSYETFARAFLLRRLGISEELVSRACDIFLSAFELINTENVWTKLESKHRDPNFFYLSSDCAAACHFIDTGGIFDEERLIKYLIKGNMTQIDSTDPMYLLAKKRPSYAGAYKINGRSAKTFGEYEFNAILIVEPDLNDCKIVRNTEDNKIIGELTDYTESEWETLLEYCNQCKAGIFILSSKDSTLDRNLSNEFIGVEINNGYKLHLKVKDYVNLN